MPDPRDRITTLRENRIPNSDALTDADRAVLLAFSDELDLRGVDYSDHRHEKLLRHCVRMAEHAGGLHAVTEDREAAEAIVRWINREYDNEETNRDYRVALRVFAKYTSDGGDEVPDTVDWVSGQTSRSYNPKPDPRDVLHWDDHVVPMIDACKNTRDAAVIATAWDAGARSGEFRALKIGDITDHQHGFQITVDGKTGQRTVTLIPSVPYLQRWLQDHPARDDATAPLWSKLNTSDDISFRMFKKLLEEAAERAGVQRPVTLTNFRKSSASYLASEGMNQAHIEEHHGWTRGSKVAARYVSVFGDAAEHELAKIHGLEVADEESDPLGPVECPRCEKQTPRDREFCVWCEQALQPDAVETLKTDERTVQRAVMRLAQDNPSLLEDVEEREQIMAVIEDNPDLQHQVRRLLDAD